MKRKLKFDNLDLLFRRLKKRRIYYTQDKLIKNTFNNIKLNIYFFQIILICFFFFQRFKLFF